MSIEEVRIEQIGHILRVQLSRPQKKNALTPPMYRALCDAFNHADEDPAIHVIYLTGSADSFSAGNDLNTFRDNPEDRAAHQFITTISRTATPIVAAVNGLAVGVGVTMLLHCDLVYTCQNASFNFAFIDLGVVPEAASSFLMPRLVGQRKAAELLLLGGRFDAQVAQDVGLVNQVLADEELTKVAWKAAEQLARKPPEALLASKALLKRGTAQVVAETIEAESNIFRERLHSAEVRSILAAMRQ